ncbi:hypothetical protein GCM10027449_29550 [Sinomonas notoginsengisoli]
MRPVQCLALNIKPLTNVPGGVKDPTSAVLDLEGMAGASLTQMVKSGGREIRSQAQKAD